MSIFSSISNIYDSIFNPIWHAAKKEMDQAVESVGKIVTDKEEFKRTLESMGYETGSIVEDVGTFIKGFSNYLKWAFIFALAVFIAWIFFGRKT